MPPVVVVGKGLYCTCNESVLIELDAAVLRTFLTLHLQIGLLLGTIL